LGDAGGKADGTHLLTVTGIGEYRGSRTRILLADDDPQVRELFAGKLRSAGYRVSEAQSGAEALSLLRGSSFAEIDGLEVLKIVRTEFPRLRVLAISGCLPGVLLKAAESFGARLALDKSLASQLLVESTRKVLRGRNRRAGRPNRIVHLWCGTIIVRCSSIRTLAGRADATSDAGNCCDCR